MNERIDDLAKLAGLHKEWFIDCPEIEKFAELILAQALQHLTNIGHDASREALEKHFVVKA